MTASPRNRLIESVKGVAGRYFPWLGGQVAIVPDAALDELARRPEVAAHQPRSRRPRHARPDGNARQVRGWVTENLGVDGLDVGVATIDSGVNAWHEDLERRVVHFADFVNGQPSAYDDYGHGTHVAGIIAGNGLDSDGAHRGIAPGAHLVVLKALDVSGNGFTSNVIAAIDYAIANRAAFNIRVLNLSVAAGVYESFTKDPLTLAAKRAVDAGIVVVAAAGNRGRGYGGPAAVRRHHVAGQCAVGPDCRRRRAISAPPSVDDDVVAAFSSRGPAPIDDSAKPDIVAPGVGIESTADASSALFAANPSSRLWGTVNGASEPYLSLTGTSMAAPVVTGAIALMLEANPGADAQRREGDSPVHRRSPRRLRPLTQGAGFLNARGAVELSRAFARSRYRARARERSGALEPADHLGQRRVSGGMLGARANAWRLGVTWGDIRTPPATRSAGAFRAAARTARATTR